MFWEFLKCCPLPVVSLGNSSGKCCPLPLSMEKVPGAAAHRWKQLSLLLPSLSSAEVLAELEGCKREHQLERSGIQGLEMGCSVPFLLMHWGMGISALVQVVFDGFCHEKGKAGNYTQKPILSRAAVHLLVTTYRELFCFFLINPSTGTSAGNLRRNH